MCCRWCFCHCYSIFRSLLDTGGIKSRWQRRLCYKILIDHGHKSWHKKLILCCVINQKALYNVYCGRYVDTITLSNNKKNCYCTADKFSLRSSYIHKIVCVLISCFPKSTVAVFHSSSVYFSTGSVTYALQCKIYYSVRYTAYHVDFIKIPYWMMSLSRIFIIWKKCIM